MNSFKFLLYIPMNKTQKALQKLTDSGILFWKPIYVIIDRHNTLKIEKETIFSIELKTDKKNKITITINHIYIDYVYTDREEAKKEIIKIYEKHISEIK